MVTVTVYICSQVRPCIARSRNTCRLSCKGVFHSQITVWPTVHLNSQRNIKYWRCFADNVVNLIWILEPLNNWTTLMTGQPMLISTISAFVLVWIKSAALQNSASYRKLDGALDVHSHRCEACERSFLIIVRRPFSEIISITKTSANSFAMVRKAELVTPAIGARTVRWGISTFQSWRTN